MIMKEMVKELHYKDQPHEDEVSSVKGKYGGDGEDSSNPSSQSFGNGDNGNSSKKSSPTHNEPPDHNISLKLDVKLDLPIHDIELNVEKLDN